MAAVDFKISVDGWQLKRGEKLENSVVTKRISSGTKYESPLLDDVVSEDRAILLENEIITACNVCFEVPPTSLIHFITLISDCRKLETFVGKLPEYMKTFHGELLDDFEGTQTFRFDIDLCDTITTELCLKLIPNSTEVWIYGIEAAIKPNLKALSASIFTPSINLENVENILNESSHKLTPNAEKCKSFLQSYMQSKNSAPPNMQMLMSMINGNFNRALTLSNDAENSSTESRMNGAEEEKPANENYSSSALFSHVTSYVNNKIDEVERRIQRRIDEMERNQNIKLDKIIELLNSR